MTKSVMEDALGIARGYAGEENCVVSHPDAGGPCGRPATGMVWELGFCEVHGIEAAAAALEELTEDAEMGFEALVGAEKGRPESNPVLLHVLKEAEVPARDARRALPRPGRGAADSLPTPRRAH